MIRAVIFDLDGTLFDRATSVDRCLRAQYRRFPDLAKAISEPLYVSRFCELDSRGYVRKDLVYPQLVSEYSLPVEMAVVLFEDFYTHYHHHAIGLPDLNGTLERLRSDRFVLGIITNGRASHQRATIQALGIESYFGAILISEAEGLKKPDSRIFHRALDQLGVRPEEAVFVGDHPEVDVRGARDAGMWSVWRRDLFWGECQSAHATIDNLHSLSSLLLGTGPWVAPHSPSIGA